jgi:hypothetical protein
VGVQAMSSFPEITEAKVVRVEPGDVIWLKTELHLTAAQAVAIKESAKRIWPDNEIAIGQDIDLVIVRPEP